MDVQEILERLRPTLANEGVEVELVAVRGPQLEIRARRSRPGVPVAFLVKAIEGTFKRYHPEIHEVLLSEYDPGENMGKPARNAEFDRVLHARPGAVAEATPGWLGLDLDGLDRAEAMRALENGHRVFTGQGKTCFGVRGLEDPNARAAFEKWVSFYGHPRHVLPLGEPGSVAVLLDDTAPELPESVLWMPGRIVLVSA